jgi:uncharacterized membrane protein
MVFGFVVHPADIAAAGLFALCVYSYEPALARLARGAGVLNADLAPVRAAWIARMLARGVRIMDANLLGHMINSATFFASTNLLVIAAACGVLFGGADTLARLNSVVIVAPAAPWLMEAKIALVVVMLARGLLDFIWAIRQLNYCLVLLGAAPESDAPAAHEAFGAALTSVLNPAFNAFNRGVRGYYFALAAAAWIVSPWAMALAILGAYALLLRRQSASPAALGVRAARRILETNAAAAPKQEEG